MSIISPRNVGGRGAIAVCSRPTIWRWRASFSFYFLRLSSLRFFGSPLSESPWLEVFYKKKKKKLELPEASTSHFPREKEAGVRGTKKSTRGVWYNSFFCSTLFHRLSSLLLTQQLSSRRKNVNGIFALSARAEGEIIWRTSGDFYHVLSCCSALNRFDCWWIVTDKEIDAGFRSVAAMMEASLCYFKIWQRPNDEIWAK